MRDRCGDDLSKRFESLTFDSFAKQILDRFKQALPEGYKISDDYDVELSDRKILDNYRFEDENYLNSTDPEVVLKLHAATLPHSARTKAERIRNKIWKEMLSSSPSQLSFKMIMRLAELIIKTNPKIKKYLQQTYHYVFLDEFQDTTDIQYDLFKTCFLGSGSHFTAVGDDKQRIMIWAGAQNTVFEDFMDDTGAARVALSTNFRCAPRLVTLLNHLTEHLLEKTDFATPSDKWQPDQGECSIWLFENAEKETQILFREVKEWITTEGINARDICILVKQQLTMYAGNLIEYFNRNGIKARDENKYQDMLTQEVSVFIINVLYLIYDPQNTNAKKDAFDFLSNIHTELEDQQLLKLEFAFTKFVKTLRKDYPNQFFGGDEIETMIAAIVDFAGKDRIRAHFTHYKNIGVLNKAIDDLEKELLHCYDVTNDIVDALDMLIGKDTIPVMTIHKSKGLEYHTVVFIGLEDGAFWSYEKQPDEDKCTFFVALSRAKERVVFTFSEVRPSKFGPREQSMHTIRQIVEELEKSGVVEIVEKN